MTVPEKEGDDIPLPEARLASSPPPPPPPPPAVSGTAVSGGAGCCLAKDCARAEEVSSADIEVSTDLRRAHTHLGASLCCRRRSREATCFCAVPTAWYALISEPHLRQTRHPVHQTG